MRGVVLLVLALAACSGGEGASLEESGERIACATGGAVQFTDDCTLERTELDGSAVLIVRHADGGFRRLESSADGQHLVAADGAETTQSALKGDRWEVILGDNRYVIPVKANAAQQ